MPELKYRRRYLAEAEVLGILRSQQAGLPVQSAYATYIDDKRLSPRQRRRAKRQDHAWWYGFWSQVREGAA